MASTFPGASPLQNALSSLGALPDTQRASLTKDAFDSIARDSAVPANVLIAFDEASGGRGDFDGARKTAQAISDLVRGGRSIEDAITTVSGDATRGRAVLDRAYDIADKLYPTAQPTAPAAPGAGGFVGTAKDVGKTLAGAALSGVGMAVDAVGALGDEAARALIKSNEIRAGRDPGVIQGTTPIRDAGRWLGNDVIGGAGRAVSESASPEFRQAMADSSFKGDITSPSTWELPADPSVAGTIGVGAQVAGTLIPVLLSGTARGAALIGGLMGGGEGVQNGRQFVLDAAKTTDETGRPAIEKLPGYQELIAKGVTPEQATAELVRRAENDAGFREGLISSVGGAVTSRIFHTAEGWLGTGGRLARAAKKAGAGFVEEGSQEVAENAASQSGINAATGAQTNIFDDSLQNFIAGGMGGGMAGAVGGAAGRQPPRQQAAPQPPEPMGALPPPPRALPAPTGPGYRPDFTMVDPRTDYVPNFTMRDPDPERAPAGPGLPGPEPRLALPAPRSSDPGAVGSGGQVVAAPGTADLSAAGPGAAMPTGPIDAIAKEMAAALPEQEPAPVTRFPEQKPGSAIRLGDPETGEIVDGVFLRETPTGALVRIAGREIEMTPQQFDRFRDTAPAIDEAAKRAADAEKMAARQRAKETPANVEPRRPDQPAAAADRPVPNPVLDDVVGSGQGTAPRRPADAAGETGVQAVDESRASAGQDIQTVGRDHQGGVAVADGTGQPGPGIAPEQRATELRREASRIRKQAREPAFGTRDERREAMRRADDMVRQAATIEDSLKQPPADTPSPRRAEWLRKRLAFLEGQAKASGWDARLLAQRQEVKRELDALKPAAPASTDISTPVAVDKSAENSGMVADDPAQPGATDQASPSAAAIETAANEAATSPQNDLPEPTQAQKEAGNYKLGRVRIGGMDISIENPKGSERKGVDSDGEPWSVTMPAHYGYVRRTEGADGDHVDVYIGDNPDSDKVFVVDQVDAKTGKFDEHKAILGTNSLEEATTLYDAGFSDGKGPQRRGAVTELTVAQFRDWAMSGDTKAPISDINPENGNVPITGADKPKPKPRKQKRSAFSKYLDRLENYFKPGRIVPSYIGEDRVISFNRPVDDNGNWSVTVESVSKSGGVDNRPRNHATAPSERELVKWEKTHPIGSNGAETVSSTDVAPVREQRVPITNSPTVADITGNELGTWADIRQLGRKAAAWYRRTFLGDKAKPVVNANTGWTIEFNKTGAGKIGGRKGEDIYKAVVALPQILEQGVLVNSEPDKRGRPDIKAIHKIAATVRIDGRDVPLVATIRETPDGKYHYDLSRENEGDRMRSAEPLGNTKLGQPALEGISSDINIDLAEDTANTEQNDNAGTDPFPDVSKMTNRQYRQWAMSGDGKAIADALKEALDRAGIGSKVNAVLSSSPNLTVRGNYRKGWITVFRQGNSWRRTINHEIVHALRDPELWNRDYGLFTADEWRALVKAARRNADIRAWVETSYPALPTASQSEEMVAELYAAWAAGRNATPPSGPLSRALERIGQFFRAFATALRGEGFVDAATVMERIADGSIGRRHENAPSPRPIDTLAFKRWFGNSKIIDQDGKPLVVYHGTRADIEQFTVADGNGRVGAYFTKDPDYAADYSLGKPGDRSGARTMPVYLKIENPLVITDPGFIEKAVARLRGDREGLRRRNTSYLTERDLAELRAQGYDGIVNDAMNEIIVFSPTQIKSAFNTGDFDPNDPSIMNQVAGPDFVDKLQSGKARALGMIGNLNWAKTGKVFENWLTDAMGKHDTVNILSLVPGYSLFSELGKNLPGAQTYLRLKQQMDADRNELQSKAADIVDRWVGIARRDTKANDALMDLMHESTLAGIDPTNPDGWRRIDDIGATEVGPRASKAERDRAAQVAADIAARKKTWDSLKARYDALPKRMQQLYGEVRDEYTRMSDLVDAALMDNIRTAASIAVKQAKRAHRAELKRIEDEGLTGQERSDAIGKANERLSQAMARNAESKMSKINSLRQMFESNKLLGPYFPLARFGSYFATVRDADGKVVSFSRFETKAAQDEFIRRAEAEKLGKVEHGVLGAGANLKAMVDPRFVSEVEVLLQDAGADEALQDAIWQRWLETLPDQSMRKARIHRKGRIGFDRDAIRAFSSAMFHGAHQLARLRYGLEMGEALNDAEEQAADAVDPERAGFVVREMRKRHDFTMSPTNNPLVTATSNLAFIWYLGASPATALVNVSQTTIVGVPVLAARFKKLGVGGAVKQLGRALRDFGTGRGSVVKRVNGVPVWTDTWSVENSQRLNADEKRAMAEGYKRGVIDKTQSHDLASVAETGVEYNPTRERVMRAISFMFHHTERLNREITYLAAYRMARAEGLQHQEAVDEASGLTWKTHFSYQNTDRPRVMQSDIGKILTTFRNFTANMLFRMFRDIHQTFNGATQAERAEARAQLIGVTLSLFAHAGIRGVWGYGLLMTLLGLFLPGGADDQDEWLQDALLMNGDSAGVAAWNWTMGMVLNGVPGTALGVDLTNRIGMPDLYFRTPDKDLEGKDLYLYYAEQILGPVANIASDTLTGISMMADGRPVRGIEKLVPNAASDLVKAGRWEAEGVNTYYGDPIIENITPWEALMAAAGFTPARIAERYEINNRLKRDEKRITDERKDIQREIGDALRTGEPVPDAALDRMRDFNKRFPEYPITPKSIRQSLRSRVQASARNEFGVSLNPKLNKRLRDERAPTVYASNRSMSVRPPAEEEATAD